MWVMAGGHVPVKIWADTVEPGAEQQLRDLSTLPFLQGHVAVMPDVHKGYGATVGSVFATRDVVIPYAVGVDIGCGMIAAPTDLPADELGSRLRLATLRHDIERAVPTGRFGHRTPAQWSGFEHRSRHDPITREIENGAPFQLGTLGGGNHFIELQRDPEGRAWIMLHSGSRHVGNVICRHYHQLARAFCKHEGVSPPSELEYLPMDHPEGQAYLRDMHWAQDYALENRRRMLGLVLDALDRFASRELGRGVRVDDDRTVNIHHNFAALEEHFGSTVLVHRKGATRAFRGQLAIIPGAMGRSSFVVRGLGNPESFCSCSHGAGRVMSRTRANAEVSGDALRRMMQEAGVDFDDAHAERYRDEAPVAYKDVDAVLAQQADLVEPVVRLEPLTVVKGP